jgi:hypothetical protein
MPTLYLFTLRNIITDDSPRKVAVLCKTTNPVLSNIRVGVLTNVFHSKKQSHDSVIHKHTVHVNDHTFADIRCNLHRDAVYTIHKMRGEYYFTLDNIVWQLSCFGAGVVPESNEYNEVVEYTSVIIYYS